ncbi:MAG: NUMOD3 domain-containing DNA-binding protein, partial [Candidatus Subteraquimicrobiales bacterium]|nr:NUMOD3 domain-containing DNA-binding protein [Candidatus Subteraquimicrobiales bacterium]
SNGKHSEESRKKISEAAKSRPPRSEETCKKISEANLGKIVSEETRKKMSEAHFGKTHSEETRKKISEAHFGKTVSEETRKKMRGRQKGKYRGTYYHKKTQKPWNRVWRTQITINKHRIPLGYFNDPISGEIVHNLVWKEIHG